MPKHDFEGRKLSEPKTNSWLLRAFSVFGGWCDSGFSLPHFAFTCEIDKGGNVFCDLQIGQAYCVYDLRLCRQIRYSRKGDCFEMPKGVVEESDGIGVGTQCLVSG